MSKPEKHSFNISGHKTSITLEPEFWQVFKMIAERDHESLSSMVVKIDNQRGEQNLSSAVRVFILNALTEEIAYLNDKLIER